MLTSGLIGYWPFNGTVADASGSGNNLGLFGDATLVSGGLFGGGALSLDGVQGTYAQALTNNTQFDLAGDFTVQIWAKFNDFTNGREETLIEKFSGASGPGWSLTLVGGNDIRLGFGVDGGGLLNSGTELIPNGIWQEFVVERSGNTFSTFWDGNLVASATTTGPIDDPSSNPLLIGARDAQDGRNFTVDGLIDNVAIWDRALTPAEIAQTWNNGAGEQLSATAAQPSLFRQVVLFGGYDIFGNLGLWVTDGRAADTHELTGITGAYPAGLSPYYLTAFNSRVLFDGYDSGGNFGLWVSDGTAAGTHELTGISGARTTGSGLNAYGFTVLNGRVLFSGSDTNGNRSLWTTDGTAAGTFELTGIPGAYSGVGLGPQFMTNFNGEVLFEGTDISSNSGLWVTDGTAAGTSELTGIGGASARGVSPSNLTVFNSEVLFDGTDTSGYTSLWVTDGTSTGTHELIGISGVFSSGLSAEDFTVLNDEVLFFGQDASGRRGLWATNGTAAGTHELIGTLGLTDLSPQDLTVFNGEVLFDGRDAVNKRGLWVTDGTAAGTHEIVDISGANSTGLNPSSLTVYNGGVLFYGLDASGNRGLWFTDGTAADTYELTGISGAYAGGIQPQYFAILDQPIPPPENFTGNNTSDIL